MATIKKSINVDALAGEIFKLQSAKKGKTMTAKQIMAELRKRYTFSKDKWNAARHMLTLKGTTQATAQNASKPKKPSSKPQKPTSMAKPAGIAIEVGYICDGNKDGATKSIFDLMEIAKHIGLSLIDEAIKEYNKMQKCDCKQKPSKK